MAENQYAFPTETLSLPSKGLLYPKDSPLSSGTIDVKYMTAKEEDILTSTNLVEKGIVIDKLLESVIADPKVKLDDLLVGDKNALMVGTRVLGYGKDYRVEIKDPDTGNTIEHTFDLTKLENTKWDEKLFKSGVNEFEWTTPLSKNVIKFRLTTHKDEKAVNDTLNALKKVANLTGVSKELTTRLKQQIIAVDDNTDSKAINDFVDNQFLAQDSRAFREHIRIISPDIDFEVEILSEIGEPHKVQIPVGVRFFWPDARV
tara:strand:+ start:15 stop:791 length:777 start_codon:yes stop_codon:yes gene_type:complete